MLVKSSLLALRDLLSLPYILSSVEQIASTRQD